MKKSQRKSLVLLIALALLLTCAVSGTAAFLAVGSGPLTNTFTPAKLDTKIVEAFNGQRKSAIHVQNNGTIDAYVRVGVYGYWAVKDSGGDEKIIAPWSFTATPADGWAENGGWYYYTRKLAPGETTGNLLKTDITEAGQPDSYPSAYLVVNVIHQSIQTEPAQALTDANWGWTPGS